MTRECEDAISRQAVLDEIDNTFRCKLSYTRCREHIEQLPPATPQPKIGHWLKDSRGTLCSICRGYAIDDDGLTILTDYCPWCGAKMQEVEE